MCVICNMELTLFHDLIISLCCINYNCVEFSIELLKIVFAIESNNNRVVDVRDDVSFEKFKKIP